VDKEVTLLNISDKDSAQVRFGFLASVMHISADVSAEFAASIFMVEETLWAGFRPHSLYKLITSFHA
jgi:hypothetical protein